MISLAGMAASVFLTVPSLAEDARLVTATSDLGMELACVSSTSAYFSKASTSGGSPAAFKIAAVTSRPRYFSKSIRANMATCLVSRTRVWFSLRWISRFSSASM